MEKKIFVSTGEVSGDLHLSYIVEKMREEDPTVKFYGAAGEHSRKVGVEIIQDINELAVMGFIEGIKKYSFLKARARDYIDFIKKNKVDKVILVDYGGFNLKFLELLKLEAPKVEVFYYIPPKVWIWGEKRVKKIKKADHIVVIFPWEVDFYKKHGIDAVYFGNPFSEKYSCREGEGDSILLLPGSRKQEIKLIFPEMLEVVKKMKSQKFILKLSSRDHISWIEEDLSKVENLHIETVKTLAQCVEECKIAIATSGTVTLELSLLGIPTIVVYKTGAINAFIVRNFIKLTYVSLPNLTLDEEVFPELLQEKCTSKSIIDAIDNLLIRKEEIDYKIQEIREKLSGDEILKSYAKYILEGKIDEKI